MRDRRVAAAISVIDAFVSRRKQRQRRVAVQSSSRLLWVLHWAEERGAEQAWLWPDVTTPSDDMCVVLTAARTKTAAAFGFELAAGNTLASN